MIRNPPPQAIAMSASKPPSRRWTSGEESQLREMLEAGRTADEIADALDRTPYLFMRGSKEAIKSGRSAT
jgi:hypothetical protein